jgi:hypothetical protein
MSAPRPLQGFECLAPASQSTPSAPASRGRRGKRERFTGMLNPFVELRLRELTRAEVVVWLILYRDERGGISRTAHSDMAKRGGLSTRAVVDAVKSLRKRGLLETVRRGRMNVGPSVHRLLAPATK